MKASLRSIEKAHVKLRFMVSALKLQFRSAGVRQAEPSYVLLGIGATHSTLEERRKCFQAAQGNTNDGYSTARVTRT